MVLVSILIFFIAGGTSLIILKKIDSANKTVSTTDLIPKEPEYKTVLPENKTTEEVGVWHKGSNPTSSDQAYSYSDKIDAVSITVTQQPLPEDIAETPDEAIATMAENFNVGEKVSDGTTTIYIRTMTAGSQYVIFHKKGLLISITSTNKIEGSKWMSYVEALN